MPRTITVAPYACQAAQGAGEGSQGSVFSSRGARMMHVPEEGGRGVEGRELGDGRAGVICVLVARPATALVAR